VFLRGHDVINPKNGVALGGDKGAIEGCSVMGKLGRFEEQFSEFVPKQDLDLDHQGPKTDARSSVVSTGHNLRRQIRIAQYPSGDEKNVWYQELR
jgi:hypothetical protein